MSVQTQIDRIEAAKEAIATAIADKGVSVPDGTLIDGMPDLIAAIEGGGGGDVEPIKAFCPQTLSNEIQVKNIAPLIPFEGVASAYTNAAATISVSFTFGNVGNTYILALATRKPSGEPTAPSGWEKCVWIEPNSNSTSLQYLYIAKHTTTSAEAGTVCEIEFPVTAGQRHYLSVVSVGDSEISTNDVITTVGSGEVVLTPTIYEHSIVVCSSETTIAYTDAVGWNLASGFSDSYTPSFNDGAAQGGRLGVLYIPYLSEQPFSNPEINVCVNDGENTMSTTTGTICTVFRLIPGTASRFEALLDVGEITPAQALSIITGGDY